MRDKIERLVSDTLIVIAVLTLFIGLPGLLYILLDLMIGGS